MRLDDDVFREASKRARVMKVTLGKALSDLARRGLQIAPPVKRENGLTVFDPPGASKKVTQHEVEAELSDFP